MVTAPSVVVGGAYVCVSARIYTTGSRPGATHRRRRYTSASSLRDLPPAAFFYSFTRTVDAMSYYYYTNAFIGPRIPGKPTVF